MPRRSPRYAPNVETFGGRWSRRASRLRGELRDLTFHLTRSYHEFDFMPPALTQSQHDRVRLVTITDYDNCATMDDVTIVFDLNLMMRGERSPTTMRLTVVCPPEYPFSPWDVTVSRVNHPAVYLDDDGLGRIRLTGLEGDWSPSFNLAYLIRSIFATLEGFNATTQAGGHNQHGSGFGTSQEVKDVSRWKEINAKEAARKNYATEKTEPAARAFARKSDSYLWKGPPPPLPEWLKNKKTYEFSGRDL